MCISFYIISSHLNSYEFPYRNILHTLNFGSNHRDMKVSCRIIRLIWGLCLGALCGFGCCFGLLGFFNQQLLRSWQILRIRQVKVPCCMAMPVALLCLQTSGKLQCCSKYILILLCSAH